MRVWREFPSGPTGRVPEEGPRHHRLGVHAPAAVRLDATVPDPDPSRYFYGKSFIYSAFAAPFVRVFGTNGFLVLHALLLALVAWCSYLFLHARMRAGDRGRRWPAAFLMASVVPVYFVWITPELFNFALGLLAYFCWLYKEVATPDAGAARACAGCSAARSDVVAAVLLGIATFSKVTNALLFPPIVLWLAVAAAVAPGDRQQRSRSSPSPVGLFAINMAISGEWNYQGGEDRATFYHEFPFQTPGRPSRSASTKERDEALTDIIFDRRVFWTNLMHNLGYFFVGRYAGMLPYFFPALFALVAFLVALRRRPAWQYFVLAAALGADADLHHRHALHLARRRRIGRQPLLHGRVRPVPVPAAGDCRGSWLAFVPWIVGALFTAPLVLNPFFASFYPGSYAKHGPLRWLPVELTLVYDWPINTDASRVRGLVRRPSRRHGHPGFQIYFLDDNALPAGSGQELLGEGRVARRVPDQDRPADDAAPCSR